MAQPRGFKGHVVANARPSCYAEGRGFESHYPVSLLTRSACSSESATCAGCDELSRNVLAVTRDERPALQRNKRRAECTSDSDGVSRNHDAVGTSDRSGLRH